MCPDQAVLSIPQMGTDHSWATVIRENDQAPMRALAFFAASALLLAACQSKRETCAL